MEDPSGVQVRDLAFRHPGAATGIRVPAIDLAPGAPVALAGPSGSGKTTLLRLLTGLLTPDEGSIRIGETFLGDASPAWVRDWRLREAGLIFQDFALLPYLTARENVQLPSRFLPASCNAPGIQERAAELAQSLGLSDHWDKPASVLSQGERQRVAIARALAHGPSFVFADEPTASLDPTRRDSALELLISDARARKAVLLVITHDVERLDNFEAVLRMEDFLT